MTINVTNYTIKSIHKNLLLPISLAINTILQRIILNPTDVQPHLELFLFAPLVLCSMPFSDFRKLRQRNRQAAQHRYTASKLQLWNNNRSSLISAALSSCSSTLHHKNDIHYTNNNNNNDHNSNNNNDNHNNNNDNDATNHTHTNNIRNTINNNNNSNLRRAERLLREEGQLSKAINTLLSYGLAPFTPNTTRVMQLKHPTAPLPSYHPPSATNNVHHMFTVTTKQVLTQLRSFSKGTACGRSGWRIQHYLQLSNNHDFLTYFTSVINLYLQGSVPHQLAPFIVSGNLIPLLKKKDGDLNNLRPIVVGEVFRRLLSKLCISSISTKTLQDLLQPLQLGVGVSGGVEAIIHSFNRLIRQPNLPESFVITQIDFSNAFNEVNRHIMLQLVQQHFPQLFPWISFCYSVAAPLFLGSNVIYATSGVQQGDPLSSLLFALVLQPFLVKFQSQFHLTTAAFLDDVTLGGPLTDSIAALQFIIDEGPPCGLILSPKTIIWSPFNHPITLLANSSTNQHRYYSVHTAPGLPLLGSGISLHPEYFNNLAMQRLQKCSDQVSIISQLNDPQLELMLFRSCLGAPKLLYALHTSPPTFIHNALATMENFIRTTLCSILINNNDSSRFGDFQFKLTSLPIRFGGLGISNPIDLSHFVYIASVDYTWNLQNNILNFSFEPIHPKEYLELKSQFVFTFLHNNPDALPPHPTFSNLATLVYTFNSNQLFNQHPFLSTKPIDIQRRFKAILSSFQSQSANHYLFALPNYGLNQVMTKLEFHTHMALRLLLPIFPPNQKCSRPTCNLRMDSHGYHALCCPGRSMFARHELLAWALYYAAFDAGIHPQWKAPVSCLGPSWNSTGRANSGVTSFRPADLLFPPPWNNKPTCIDVTVISPIHAAVPPANFVIGKAANIAESNKIAKHLSPCELAGFNFIPFGVDCFGNFGKEAISIINQLRSSLIQAKGLPQYLATQLIYRRLSFAIHLGTARQLLSRFPSSNFTTP